MQIVAFDVDGAQRWLPKASHARACSAADAKLLHLAPGEAQRWGDVIHEKDIGRDVQKIAYTYQVPDWGKDGDALGPYWKGPVMSNAVALSLRVP